MQRVHIQDLRVYLCDGHRPAHDSSPYVSGIALTEQEWRTLTGRLSNYLDLCRKRRLKEGRCPQLRRAAERLGEMLRDRKWLVAVGMSTDDEGEGLLIVYVVRPLTAVDRSFLPTSLGANEASRQFPVTFRVTGRVLPATAKVV